MRDTSLVYPVRKDGRILLGHKRRGLDVADLTVDALLCRRDAAIAIDVHASPFWLKDNERHF